MPQMRRSQCTRRSGSVRASTLVRASFDIDQSRPRRAASIISADFYPFDMKFLGETATRIIDEVKGVNREWCMT